MEAETEIQAAQGRDAPPNNEVKTILNPGRWHRFGRSLKPPNYRLAEAIGGTRLELFLDIAASAHLTL